MHKSNDKLSSYEFDFVCGSGDKVIGKPMHYNRLNFVVDNRDEEPHYQQDLVFLTMWECCCPRLTRFGTEEKRCLEALALKPARTGKNQYERVGMLIVPESAYDFYAAHETEDELSLVLL
jgi:hypothetical protein